MSLYAVCLVKPAKGNPDRRHLYRLSYSALPLKDARKEYQSALLFGALHSIAVTLHPVRTAFSPTAPGVQTLETIRDANTEAYCGLPPDPKAVRLAPERRE